MTLTNPSATQHLSRSFDGSSAPLAVASGDQVTVDLPDVDTSTGTDITWSAGGMVTAAGGALIAAFTLELLAVDLAA